MTARPAASSPYAAGPPVMWGTWARKIRIARALTNPTMTVRGTNRMRPPTPTAPSATWMTPAKTVAANMYSTPCSLTRGTSTGAMAPVAAEIIPRRPPARAMPTEIENDAYRPTLGSTPAMIENDTASGMRASATTSPLSRLTPGSANHSSRRRERRVEVTRAREESKETFCGAWRRRGFVGRAREEREPRNPLVG